VFEGDKCIFGAVVLKSQLPGTRYFVGVIRRGPVFVDVDAAIELWAKFEAELIRNRCIGVMVQPYWERQQAKRLQSYLAKSNYRLSNRTSAHDETLVIDLSNSEEEILANVISSNRRNMIRKGIRMGIEVRLTTNCAQLYAFWRMHHKMCNVKNLPGPKWEDWKRIAAYSKSRPKDCACMLAYLGEKLIGGATLLRNGNRVVYTWGSSTTEDMPGTPKTELALWEGIRWAKSTGASIFDLGGIATEAEERSAVWYVGKFKKGFSSQHVMLMQPAEKIFKPILYCIHKSLQIIKRAIWQCML